MSENDRPLIIHDAFIFPGGGETVAMNLARILSADILTAKLSHQSFPAGYFDIAPLVMKDSPFCRWPLNRSQTFSLGSKMLFQPRRKRRLTFFSGQVAPLAAFGIQGPKVLYCHTPPRQLYDLRQYYLNALPPLRRAVKQVLLATYGRLFERAVGKMDLVIANSRNVGRRIEKYWNIKDVPVLYPPCGELFAWRDKGDYYLSTARHDKLKRVDVIIRAFLEMPEKKLIVASAGPETEYLKKLTGGAPNITFTGMLKMEEMVNLVGRCLATVHIPVDEDFGISPVESMAAGKPVLGVNEGGLTETILDKQTGWLLPSPAKPEDIIRLVRELAEDACLSMRSACERQALNFSAARFRSGILQLKRQLETGYWKAERSVFA